MALPNEPSFPFPPPEPPAPDPYLVNWEKLKPFYAWCCDNLPTMFDNCMSDYEKLCKMQWVLNNVISNMEVMRQAFESLHEDESDFKEQIEKEWADYQEQLTAKFTELQNYVNDYFDNLDLQDEVNNNIQNMVESGEFLNLISPTIINYVYPTIVDSTAQMTDQKKMYILKSTGILYAWNGTEFEATGIIYGGIINALSAYGKTFNSTDTQPPTLYQDCNTIPIQTMTCYLRSTVTGGLITNYPEKFANDGFFIICIQPDTVTDIPAGRMQIAVDLVTGEMACRVAAPAWKQWFYLTPEIDYTKILTAYGKTFNATDVQPPTLYQDCNTIPIQTMTCYTRSTMQENLITNYPTYFANDGFFIMCIQPDTVADIPAGRMQIAVDLVTGEIAIRTATPAWHNWNYIGKNALYPYGVTFDNVNLKPPQLYQDCNTIPIQTICCYVSSAINAGLIANYPTRFSNGFTIITLQADTGDTTGGRNQIAINLVTGDMAVRTASPGWHNWNYIGDGEERILEVGAGKQFPTIKSAAEYCMQIPNCHFIVYPGTYDIIGELGWDVQVPSTTPYGLLIGNNVTFEFMEGAILEGIYNGNDEQLKLAFSVFNIAGNAKLINANIHVKNVRYCVHDDIRAYTPAYSSYIAEYIDCVMYNEGGGYTAGACIGAGTSNFSIQKVIGGDYKSTYEFPLTWHNADVTTTSKIIVRDAYVQGKIRGWTYIPEKNDVTMQVTNCKCNAIQIDGDQISLNTWNNLVQ